MRGPFSHGDDQQPGIDVERVTEAYYEPRIDTDLCFIRLHLRPGFALHATGPPHLSTAAPDLQSSRLVSAIVRSTLHAIGVGPDPTHR